MAVTFCVTQQSEKTALRKLNKEMDPSVRLREPFSCDPQTSHRIPSLSSSCPSGLGHCEENRNSPGLVDVLYNNQIVAVFKRDNNAKAKPI
jgi:hypothetical protein